MTNNVKTSNYRRENSSLNRNRIKNKTIIIYLNNMKNDKH